MGKKIRRITPSYMHLMFLFMLVFYELSAIGVGYLLRYIVKNVDENFSLNIVMSLLLSQILIWSGLLIYMLITRRNPFVKADFSFGSKPVKVFITVLLIPIFTFAIYPVVIFLNLLTMMFAENAVESVNAQFDGYSLLAQLIVMALIPAVSEELICRGALFGGLKRTRIFAAAVVSGLYFGILHLNINQFAYATFLGIMLALLNECTGYIYSSMLVHFLINAFSVVVTYFSSGRMAEAAEELAGESVQTGAQSIQALPVITKIVALVMYGGMAVMGFALACTMLYVIAYVNDRQGHLKSIFRKGSDNPYSDGQEKKRMVNVLFFVPVVLGLGYMIFTEYFV